MGLDEAVRKYLKAHGDERTVTTDASARYFGIEVDDQSLRPGEHPRLGAMRFEEWLEGAK
jgi:hypothetical protein